jgi:hypothetical protein
MARLHRIKARAASLSRLVDMQIPAPDQERLSRSLAQLENGEAVTAEDFLIELKR